MGWTPAPDARAPAQAPLSPPRRPALLSARAAPAPRPLQPGVRARAGPRPPDPCPPLTLNFRELACFLMWQQPPILHPGRPVNIYRAAERHSPGCSWPAGSGRGEGAAQRRGRPSNGQGWAPRLCVEGAGCSACSLRTKHLSQTESNPCPQSPSVRVRRPRPRGLPPPPCSLSRF